MLSNEDAYAYMNDLKAMTKKCNDDAQKSLELMREATERNDHEAFSCHNAKTGELLAASDAYSSARKMFMGYFEGGNV